MNRGQRAFHRWFWLLLAVALPLTAYFGIRAIPGEVTVESEAAVARSQLAVWKEAQSTYCIYQLRIDTSRNYGQLIAIPKQAISSPGTFLELREQASQKLIVKGRIDDAAEHQFSWKFPETWTEQPLEVHLRNAFQPEAIEIIQL